MYFMKVQIYHYPKCSTSVNSLAFLRSKGLNPEIILYCDKGVTKDEILNLMKMLDMSNSLDIIKRNGITYRNLGIAGKNLSHDELLDIIMQNPKLLQRPIIVIDDKKAVIGKNLNIIDKFLNL
jgi:arsenate reductase